MSRDWHELDEDELRELEEVEDEVPRGWRPGPEAIRAIEGEPMESDEEREELPSIADTSDLEEARLSAAAERLKQIEWLKPEKWAQLDTYEKVVALNSAGRELAEVYQHPNPPLLVKDMGDPDLLGAYGDGYRFNSDTGEIEGADYRITMSRSAEIDYKKLLGDDPTAALRTYAHEFRHSYQAEQAARYDKPQFRNLVDNAEAAKEWSENLRHYITPNEDYDAYRNQPVERDARDFAEELVKQVYG